MNRKHLQMVRDRIAAEPPERLDMGAWHCNTCHCVGGWTDIVALIETGETLESESDTANFLGLSYGQATDLFYPEGWNEGVAYTQTDALAALDSLIHAETDDAMPVWPEKSQ